MIKKNFFFKTLVKNFYSKNIKNSVVIFIRIFVIKILNEDLKQVFFIFSIFSSFLNEKK